jgi:hypothetical protein
VKRLALYVLRCSTRTPAISLVAQLRPLVALLPDTLAWLLNLPAAPSAYITAGAATVKSVLYPTLCLDVLGGALVAGANMVVMTCSAGGEG